MSIIQTIQETFLLLIISVDFMRGIVGHLSELGDVLVHRHGHPFQISKLFLIQLDHSLGNMMCTKSSSEFRPVDALGFLMDLHVGTPPVSCKARKLVRGQQHLLTVVALHYFQHLLNGLEPIIGIHRLHNTRKGRWLSALKSPSLSLGGGGGA
jgi:hypothetical protein